MSRVFLFWGLIFFSSILQAQVEVELSETDYSENKKIRFEDYSDKLLVRIMSVTKKNDQEISTFLSDSLRLSMSHLGLNSLGFGVNYKWFGVGIAFGVPAKEEDIEKFGKTRRLDFQLNIYSKRFIADLSMQRYKGYYISNPKELTIWDSINFPQLNSMETFSLGISGNYVFNYKKFSYRAAFVRNAIQKKSAGSFLLGGFYNQDYAGFSDDATEFFVPSYFPQAVRDSFDLSSYRVSNYGISFGYAYTLVIKRFFVSLSLLPSIGFRTMNLVDSEGNSFDDTTSAERFSSRIAVGFEFNKFLIGLTGVNTIGKFQSNGLEIRPTTNNAKFFIAKRFDVKKDRLQSNNP